MSEMVAVNKKTLERVLFMLALEIIDLRKSGDESLDGTVKLFAELRDSKPGIELLALWQLTFKEQDAVHAHAKIHFGPDDEYEEWNYTRSDLNVIDLVEFTMIEVTDE